MNQEFLKSVLHYDCDSGIFIWKRGNLKGHVAGYKHPHGYIQIWVSGKPHYAHRLAWLYVHGNMPSNHIDHIDGVKSNNAIANLRDCDRSANMRNQKKAHKNSKSGLIGVTKQGNRWRARLKINGIEFHIGVFDEKELASTAYENAKKRVESGLPII